MFTEIRDTTPEARIVRGETWLYNRKEYARLFPPQFAASAKEVEPGFQYRALWGQFVRSDGNIQTEQARTFLENVAGLKDVRNLGECFPLQILRTECDIAAFYALYGIPVNAPIARLGKG